MGDVCLSNLKRSEEALEHYRRAAELNPALGPAHARLASLCIQLGHPEGAAAAIATLRKISPKMPELAELEVHLREATHSGVSK